MTTHGVAHEPQPPSDLVTGVVITVSDRCSAGDAQDTSGPLAATRLAEHNVHVEEVIVVPDDVDYIAGAMQEAIDAGARVILTTGGTGITPRDVTPEATAPFIALPLEGLAQQVRQHGLKATPLSALSRGHVGLTARGAGGALVMNAPGSNNGVVDMIDVVGPLIGHILGQLEGRQTR